MLIYSLVFLQKKGYRFETNSPVDWRRFIWTDEKINYWLKLPVPPPAAVPGV